MHEEFRYVTRDQLFESPWQTRRHYDATRLKEFAESIKSVGILTPLLVRPASAPANIGHYEIGAGHRRFRAAGLAKLDRIPVLIQQLDDAAFLEVITIENLQRDDIHPLDEALGYHTLMVQGHYDVPAVAARVGKSTSYIYQRLKLADLIEPAQQAFLDDTITASHALLIARLQPKDQEAALKECLENEEYGPNGKERQVLTVRELSQWIDQEIHLDLHDAPFSKKDATLVPTAGACVTCEKRTGFLPELWPDIKKKDLCTDRSCFDAKLEAHIQRKQAELSTKGEALLTLSERWHYSNGKQKDKDADVGAISRDRWSEVDKKELCDHQQKGIIVEGNKRGKLLTVCAEPTCRIHRHDRSDDVRDHAREKRTQQQAKRDHAIRHKIFQHVQEQVGGASLNGTEIVGVVLPVPRTVLNLVLACFWARTWSDTQKQLAKYYGWEHKNKLDLNHHGTDLFAQMSEEELVRFLVAWVTINSQQLSVSDAEVKRLYAFAEAYGVDVKRIEAQAKAAQKSAKTKKAPVGVHVTNGTARKPQVPTCRECGCTDERACPGGCRWVEPDLCSQCVGITAQATTGAPDAG